MSYSDWRSRFSSLHRSRSGRVFILSLLSLALFSLGFYCGIRFLGGQTEKFGPVQVREQGRYAFINPLLECEVQDARLDHIYIPFESKLKQSIDDLNREKYQNREFAMYFRDLNNGPWFGINSSAAFTPASLMKVPLMIAYYKQAEGNPALLNKQVVLQDGDPSFYQNITSGAKLEVGKKYSIEEVINFMIINSDNGAMMTLLENIEQGQLDRVYQDLGISIPNVRTPEDFMSVKEYASFFRILYNAAYLNEEYSEKALNLLSQTSFVDGLAAGIPFNLKISHKFGERRNPALGTSSNQLHECGIIYFPGHPYLLCVMTRGSDFNQLASFIADTSKLVYETMQDTYRE